MADMEALKEQLMNMKRNGKGFLCVGTDDPEEAAQIMRIAAELSQEEEQHEDEKRTGYVYTYNGEVYDDSGIAELVAENYEDIAFQEYKNNLKGFLRDLDTEEIDYLKDGVMERLDSMKESSVYLGTGKKAIRKSSWEE